MAIFETYSEVTKPPRIFAKCKVTVLFKTFALRESKFNPCSSPLNIADRSLDSRNVASQNVCLSK